MRKILILTANFTGHGHRSISDSLIEQLRGRPDVVAEAVDGFSLIGKAGVNASKMYGPCTRHARDLWKLFFNLSNQQFSAMEDMISVLIAQRLLSKLRAFDPDLIVTVHSMFNGSVLNVLEHYHLDIPFVVLEADLINIHSSWCDPRPTRVLCPSREALDCSLRAGVPEAKLELVGFPTRARFCEAARTCADEAYAVRKPLHCLLMSGGDGGTNLMRYAKSLLEGCDCELEILCGRDAKTRKRLESELLPVALGRVRVHGFVENVQDLMRRSDLVIARGSPNSLMEAVVMNVPLMIIGSLPGQEADNPALMVMHNLGVVCDTPEAAPMLVNALLADGARRLYEIRAAQRAYRNLDNARLIADRLYELAAPLDRPFPTLRGTYPFAGTRRASRKVAKRRMEDIARHP